MEDNEPISVAAHWMHEWMHVSGFRHKRAEPDHSDVPYRVGRIVRDVASIHATNENAPQAYVDNIGRHYLDSLDGHLSDVEDDVEILAPYNVSTGERL